MKFTATAAVLAFAATVAATGNTTVVTEVVESYVTYCPSATEITHGTQTYTVTEPTTLTITDCPCTITKPVITSTVPSSNATVPGVPSPTGVVPTTTPSAPTTVPTAGAAQMGVAGVAGAIGLAAFFL